MLSWSLLVYQVRLDWLPLPCIVLSEPTIVGDLPIASTMSWVRVPPEQLFFIFYGKRDVQVSCIALL